uniref:Uncharacterized protein n=1 Tax=Knipowitschia caucasica TaxID=637954 RepID=A0AAV2M3S8_KNICA
MYRPLNSPNSKSARSLPQVDPRPLPRSEPPPRTTRAPTYPHSLHPERPSANPSSPPNPSPSSPPRPPSSPPPCPPRHRFSRHPARNTAHRCPQWQDRVPAATGGDRASHNGFNLSDPQSEYATIAPQPVVTPGEHATVSALLSPSADAVVSLPPRSLFRIIREVHTLYVGHVLLPKLL